MTVFSFIIFSIVTKKWKFWLVFDINDFQVVWSADLTADECSVKYLDIEENHFEIVDKTFAFIYLFSFKHTQEIKNHTYNISVCVSADSIKK